MSAARRTATGVLAPPDNGQGWVLPLREGRWDRTAPLRSAEAAALAEIGAGGLRRSRGRGARRSPSWTALARLSDPLDAAVSALHHADNVRQRRESAHAVGVVLAHCAQLGQVYWGWTTAEWARLCGASNEEFRAARPHPTEAGVRPLVVGLGYLLAGFRRACQMVCVTECS